MPTSTRTRRVLAASAAVAAIGLGLSPICDAAPLETGAYLQAVTEHRAVIAQVTAEPRTLGLVVSGPDEVVHRVAAAPGEPARRHAFQVEGLVPATHYTFDVVDEAGALVDRGDFTTRSDDDTRRVHFAVVGDSGGQPWWIWARHAPLFRLARASSWLPAARMPTAIGAALREGAPDFWIHVGDVIYPKGAEDHYRTGFFEPFAEALRHAPVYPVLGNHDVMTENGAPFLANFTLPGDRSGARSGDAARHFTFRDGPVRVIGLDCNGLVNAEHPSIRFLRETLEAATEPWIVVANHFPIRSAYREKPREDLEAHLVPLCEEFGVDLLLAGHDHNYQRYGEPGELIEIVTGGGGKSLYEFRYEVEGLRAKAKAYHITWIEVEGARMRVTARGLDGAVLDEFVVEKPTAESALRGTSGRLQRIRGLGR